MVVPGTARKAVANVMTLSWHAMMEFEPPLAGCIVRQYGFSLTALEVTRQCVLDIPTTELASKVVGCGPAHRGDKIGTSCCPCLEP